MALPATIDSLDELPEAQRTANADDYVPYEGNDAAQKGKLILVVTKVGGLELCNPTNIESALGRQKKTNADLTATLDGWKGIAGTPDEIAVRLERADELELIDPKKEAGKLAEKQVEAKLLAATKAHEKELTPIVAENGVLKTQLQRVLRDDAARTAVAAENGGKLNKALVTVVKDRLKETRTESGEIDFVPLDEFGNEVFEDTEDRIRSLVASLKDDEDYSGLFQGTKESGGGTPPNVQQKPRQQQQQVVDKSPIKKVQDGMAELEAKQTAR